VPPEAVTSGEALADAPVLSIEHPVGAVPQGILDHFLDSEGDRSVAQIIAALGNYSRNTVESGIRREYEAGRLLRVAPGTYRLAPRKPPEPAPAPEPQPARSDGMTDEQWLDACERWLVDPGVGMLRSSVHRPTSQITGSRRTS